MKKSLIFLFVAILGFTTSCKKDNFNAEEQAATDEQLIKNFIKQNNLTAVRHESGIYYIISEPGTGSVTYSANTTVTAKYTGRYLDGNVFDNGGGKEVSFNLGGVIVGWQVGVPLIQKGGKIRLLIPSAYGYGHFGTGPIPPDAVLDFSIELTNVN